MVSRAYAAAPKPMLVSIAFIRTANPQVKSLKPLLIRLFSARTHDGQRGYTQTSV
jgi:hypothetical protein